MVRVKRERSREPAGVVWGSVSGQHLPRSGPRGEHPKTPLTGYYPKGAAPKSNQQAQIDMIEETLSRAGVKEAKAVSFRAKCKGGWRLKRSDVTGGVAGQVGWGT